MLSTILLNVKLTVSGANAATGRGEDLAKLFSGRVKNGF